MKKGQKLNVALIQQTHHVDRHVNLENSAQAIEKAAQQGAQLVLLSELHTGHYFCQSEDVSCFDLAESIPGMTTRYLGELAKTHQIVIVGSVFERRAPGIYHNTAVVLEKDGTLIGTYRKMHIPDDPGYYEKYYFTPGDQGFLPISTSVGQLGVLVCWDQWFPEAARIMALRGADLLLYPTAIGWFPGDDEVLQQQLIDTWVTMQRAHSIANCLPLLSCNRIGFEPDPAHPKRGIYFWGNSFITGTHGQILQRADATSAAILVATLDLSEIEQTRRIWPYFRDRRVEAYGDLLKKYIGPMEKM